MPIPWLPVQWPSVLDESGPAEDPAIMLSGAARIGDTPFRIMAIRVDHRLRFMPDYRPTLDQAAYDPGALETLLEDLSVVAGTDHPDTVELPTGSYVMWMAPAAKRD